MTAIEPEPVATKLLTPAFSTPSDELLLQSDRAPQPTLAASSTSTAPEPHAAAQAIAIAQPAYAPSANAVEVGEPTLASDAPPQPFAWQWLLIWRAQPPPAVA
jgi:hypothetical protein